VPNAFCVYIFSCKHARTYHATAMAICMRRRARVPSVIRSSPSAANKPAATNCHPRSRRLPFHSPQSLRNKKNRRFIGDQRRQRRAIKSACWQGRDGRARTHRSKTMRRDCAQCTFHTPTCLVEACSCRQNHRQSHQQTGWDSRRRCKRRSEVWTWEQAFECGKFKNSTRVFWQRRGTADLGLKA